MISGFTIYNDDILDRDMPSKQFCFDIDDTISDLMGLVINEYNKKYNTSYSLDDIETWDF